MKARRDGYSTVRSDIEPALCDGEMESEDGNRQTTISADEEICNQRDPHNANTTLHPP